MTAEPARTLIAVAPEARPQRVRRTARVLLVDDRDRLLLFRDTDPGLDDAHWWITPGGGIDPGESDDGRAHSRNMLRELLAERADGNDDFSAVAYALGQTPSRLVMVSLEDILGLTEQINIPGTVDEHPNWQRKISVPLEDLERSTGFKGVAAAFKATGRATT